VAGKTRRQRNRPQVFLNQTQVPLVVVNANFDFLGEASASEHPRVDIVDVVRGADEKDLVAGSSWLINIRACSTSWIWCWPM